MTPTVHPRSDADLPSAVGGSKQSAGNIDMFFVHVTTGDSLGDRSIPQWVHNIYHYHVNKLDWSDIGYNWLVDRHGDIWTGRGLHRVPAAQAGYNTGSNAVALLGDCGQWTHEAEAAVAWLERWLRERGARIARYLPHSAVSSKECPCDGGRELVASLPWDADTMDDTEDNMKLYAHPREGSPDALAALWATLADPPTFDGLTANVRQAEEWREAGDRVIAVGGPAASEWSGENVTGHDATHTMAQLVELAESERAKE